MEAHVTYYCMREAKEVEMEINRVQWLFSVFIIYISMCVCVCTFCVYTIISLDDECTRGKLNVEMLVHASTILFATGNILYRDFMW